MRIVLVQQGMIQSSIFDQAMESSISQKSIDAIKEEMNSMYDNNV
jgi:hypothetical protein